jgi:hypothetical protein
MSRSLLFRLSNQNSVHILHLPLAYYMSHSFHPPWFHHRNNIWWRVQITVKVRLSGNSSIGKVALAAYFHTAHYNSPMARVTYFFCYPASCGISTAVSKVSESSRVV